MSQKARSPFWLRMFLQGSAIALHLYQMPNLRSPFWNKSKSAIALNSCFSTKGDRSPQLNVGPIALLVTNVFAGKSDRPSSIPDAKSAIALLE
ncbi:MAG: hypothetical protein WCD53_24590 [Microcoleus sp.]